MAEKLPFLLPEITLFVTTCLVMIFGLSPRREIRQIMPWLVGFALVVAAALAAWTPVDTNDFSFFPAALPYAKVLVALVGLLLLLLLPGTVDRGDEERIARGEASFDPLRVTRPEFYAFFLFALTGLMLTASAGDLVWLFLALELTSLPGYIMVTISARGGQAEARSGEAGVKYFFLGALGAAVFLYGFTLLYGAAGTTDLLGIAAALQTNGVGPLATAGLVLAVLGLGFKIAAVPMHFYTADVYQGAAAPVSAMLAFVPKAAGFIGLIFICACAGWNHGLGGNSLPPALEILLWTMAALTMLVGNVLAILQNSVKRLLAYSSVSHSGYMLVGLVAGPAGSRVTENGVAAVLFYLLCYGVMNVGAFAVIASLERRAGQEVDSFDDLRGMFRAHPALGTVMVICALSLLGMPPLLGFFGKLHLVTAGIAAGHIPLVIVLLVNSAIAAFYYLRLVAVPLLEARGPEEPIDYARTPFNSRVIAGLISAGGTVALVFVAGYLVRASGIAATPRSVGVPAQAETPADAPQPLVHAD